LDENNIMPLFGKSKRRYKTRFVRNIIAVTIEEKVRKIS